MFWWSVLYNLLLHLELVSCTTIIRHLQSWNVANCTVEHSCLAPTCVCFLKLTIFSTYCTDSITTSIQLLFGISFESPFTKWIYIDSTSTYFYLKAGFYVIIIIYITYSWLVTKPGQRCLRKCWDLIQSSFLHLIRKIGFLGIFCVCPFFLDFLRLLLSLQCLLLKY